ncbi:MAG: porin [Verrucomicrobia bacterium]|nr:MAG: porin [Verrucomicrobiota bacterium]
MRDIKLRFIGNMVMVLGAAACLAAAQDHETKADALLDKLVEKGVLTAAEAEQLRRETAEAAPAADRDPSLVQFSWKDGLRFQSADGKTFKGKLGGRIMTDVAAFTESGGVAPVDAEAEFRRVRLYTSGKFNPDFPVAYKLQVDFAGSDVAFKDVYLDLPETPVVGGVKLGHFKEPMGLNELTSSKYITFMERATPVEAFAPSRNLGVAVGDAVGQERMTWSLGAFTDVRMEAGDHDATLSGDYRITGRLTALPWYDEASGGARLLHVGLSGSFVDPENDTVRYRSRPEAHLAPRLVDTGGIAADHSYLLGAEAALVLGPLSLQGEYLQSWVETPAGRDPSFFGAYGQVSYFLTGEHRVYDRGKAEFGRVKPKANFSPHGGGWGAWEAAVRYSYLDLNDAGVNGGRLSDVSAGLNWYLNPNMRIMFNYVFADAGDRGTADGELHAFMARFQVDF